MHSHTQEQRQMTEINLKTVPHAQYEEKTVMFTYLNHTKEVLEMTKSTTGNSCYVISIYGCVAGRAHSVCFAEHSELRFLQFELRNREYFWGLEAEEHAGREYCGELLQRM